MFVKKNSKVCIEKSTHFVQLTHLTVANVSPIVTATCVALVLTSLHLLFCCCLSFQAYINIFPLQQIIPAHLATSPIPTESHLFWISEVENRAPKNLNDDDPLDPEDPPEPPAPSATATKKKKRRRKKHKGDPRREELTPPVSSGNSVAATTTSVSGTGQNEEIFEMDLSSDEESAPHVSR